MGSSTQASLLLQKQLKDLCKNPVDGFSAGLVDETNIFEWSVTIIGPPDTLYDGGFFNAIMSFPSNYPNSPPTVKFTSEMWHPNVYPDGRVCISILHPPGDDPNGYELASERWTPVHTVESIVLSIISMLSSPNDESPANIEAAVSYKFIVVATLFHHVVLSFLFSSSMSIIQRLLISSVWSVFYEMLLTEFNNLKCTMPA